MLNQKPIILTCFARGGSTLLVNMLLSHPYMCNSAGETKKVFKPKSDWESGWQIARKRFFYDIPIRLLAGQDVFNAADLTPRRPVPVYLQRYIDRILYQGRFRARIPKHNLYQYEDVEYTREELAKCRLLTKCLNGLIFTVEMFREMYPDAVFIGLLRNGLAIAEGRQRRGYPLTQMAGDFKIIAGKMLEYEREMPNFHLMRYEDMVSDPPRFLQQLYRKVGLNLAEVPKIRVESRPITTRDGHHERVQGDYDTQLFWYRPDELHQLVKPDINDNQIRQLSREDIKHFMAIAGEIMERLGYPTEYEYLHSY